MAAAIFPATGQRRATAALRLFAGLALAASASAAGAQNLIVNPGFEDYPPPNWGNNFPHVITPWILGPGNAANVVRVDGGQAFNYGNRGPAFDADPATGAGVVQHYLDIANGANDFHQAFTVPACGGAIPGDSREATFSGWFSTRDNLSGSGSVTIREGDGHQGRVLATASARLPAPAPPMTSGNSPWVQVSGTVQVPSGSVVSIVVSMDNNVNFDEAFLSFSDAACATTTLVLAKQWVNALASDSATVTAARSGIAIATLDSTADTANETDALATPVTVYEGEVLQLSEVLDAGNAGTYDQALACSGGATLAGEVLTIVDATTPVTCTYTNSGLAADLEVTKSSSVGSVVAGGTVVYSIRAANNGPANADGAILRDDWSANPGLDCSAAVPSCTVEGTAGTACPAPLTPQLLQQGVGIPVFPAGGAILVEMGCQVTATGTP